MKLIKKGKFAFNGIKIVDVQDGVELTDEQENILIYCGWAVADEIDSIEEVPKNIDLEIVTKKGKRGWWTVTINGVSEKVRAKSEQEAIEQAKIEIKNV